MLLHRFDSMPLLIQSGNLNSLEHLGQTTYSTNLLLPKVELIVIMDFGKVLTTLSMKSWPVTSAK